jgi:lipopolysaccharide transport system ATP-binding protein
MSASRIAKNAYDFEQCGVQADSNATIRVENISKCYPIYDSPHHRLLQGLSFGRKKFYREFWALQGIDFEVNRGEVVGLLGRNGSGKSTLLQIVCGTLASTTGEVSIAGRVSGLLELGAGFNPEFTGRENIYLSAALCGLSTAEINDRFADIAAFADIGEFLDQPLKFYSSGMMVRLGFAVQTVMEPAVLVVDEALAVGDARFQKKCYEYIESFKNRGGTILFVTHDASIIVQICSWAMILEQGKIFDRGEPHRMAKEYHRLLFGTQSELSSPSGPSGDPSEERTQALSKEFSKELSTNDYSRPEGAREVRYGSKAVVVTSIGIKGSEHAGSLIFDVHESVEIFFDAEYKQDIGSEVAFGFIISNIKGIEIFGTKGGMFDVFVPPGKAGKKFRGSIKVNLAMVPGTYFLSVAVAPRHANGGEEFYDFRYDALEFKIIGTPKCFTTGLVDLQADLQLQEING